MVFFKFSIIIFPQLKFFQFLSETSLEVIMNTLFTLNNSSRAIKEILLEFSYRKDFLCSLTQEKLCDWQLKCAKANISIDILLEYASLSENIDLQLAIKTGIQTICTTHEGNEDEIEFIFKKWKSKAPEYKYNIWNDYLISHTNRENYSKAEAIVEEMSAKKIRIHSTPLRKILTYYSKLPSNQKVRHILEKHGKSLSKGSTNEILFNLCCHSNLPEQAFELFDLNKSCTKQQVQQDDSLFYVSFNHITLLINSAIRSNNIQIAEQVLNNYSADSPTFLSIRLLSLQILVIKRDFDALLESKLQYSGPQASVPELLQFYLAYASALCCSNYTNETAPLVASFYEEISHVLFDENRVKEYDDINNAYQNRLTKLANEIRVTMIKLLHQHNQFASAFAIQTFCSSNSISVPQDSCLKLLNTFIEQHNLLCVYGVFEYIKIHHAHSSEAYHAVLRYYYRVNRYPECQKILELMNTMGIPVNSTCRPILRSFNLV